MASVACDCRDLQQSHDQEPLPLAPGQKRWRNAVGDSLGQCAWVLAQFTVGTYVWKLGNIDHFSCDYIYSCCYVAKMSYTDPSVEIPDNRRHWTSGRFVQALKNWLARCTLVYLKTQLNHIFIVWHKRNLYLLQSGSHVLLQHIRTIINCCSLHQIHWKDAPVTPLVKGCKTLNHGIFGGC